jgi:hypothetical protein
MASLPGQREVDRLLEQIRTRVSELRRLEVAAPIGASSSSSDGRSTASIGDSPASSDDSKATSPP